MIDHSDGRYTVEYTPTAAGDYALSVTLDEGDEGEGDGCVTCIHLSIYMYIYVYIHIYTVMYIKNIYIHVHIHIYTYIYISSYLYIYVCVYICIYLSFDSFVLDIICI